jgi:peroxiredoxin
MSKRGRSNHSMTKDETRQHARYNRRLQAESKRRSWWAILGVAAAVAVGGFIILRSAGVTGGTTAAAGAPLGKPIAAENVAVQSTTGKDVSLAQYHGRKLVVYLYEGITCGPCQAQLQTLQQDLPAIRKMEGEVVAISVDPMNVSQSAAKQMKLGFPILDDDNHQLGTAFADFHLTTAGMDMGPVDNHAMFVLDRDGRVQWKSMAAGTMNVNESDMLNAIRSIS